ncbi:MAG: hypothetical protein WCA12_14785 [Burkholderiales bacterium]
MDKTPLSWPELAAALYDKLTGRGAEITYEFFNLEVFVPSEHTEDSPLARWKLNGQVKIRTRDLGPK